MANSATENQTNSEMPTQEESREGILTRLCNGVRERVGDLMSRSKEWYGEKHQAMQNWRKERREVLEQKKVIKKEWKELRREAKKSSKERRTLKKEQKKLEIQNLKEDKKETQKIIIILEREIINNEKEILSIDKQIVDKEKEILDIKKRDRYADVSGTEKTLNNLQEKKVQLEQEREDLKAQQAEQEKRVTATETKAQATQTPPTDGPQSSTTTSQASTAGAQAPSEANETVRQNVRKLLESALHHAEMAKEADKDPACLAINKLILEKQIDIDDFGRFLKSPERFGKKPDYDKIIAEFTGSGVQNKTEENITIPELEKLQEKLTHEATENQDNLDNFRGVTHRTEAQTKEMGQLTKRKTAIRQTLEEIAKAIQYKSRRITYNSPKEILSYLNFYIHRADEKVTPEQIAMDIHQQIDEQEKKLYETSKFGEFFRGMALFYRPTLTSTMTALAKDKDLDKITEKPEQAADKLCELTKIAKINFMNVKQWVESLSGGIEKNIHTTVPRLIAYLKFAVHEGKVIKFFQNNRTVRLIELLEQVQREHILDETEKKFKETPNMTNADKMLLYIKEMNKSTAEITDINKKLLNYNMYKRMGLMGTVGVGAAGLASVAAAPLVAVPAALAGAGLLINSYLTKPAFAQGTPEQRTMMRSGARRIGAATALGVGGLALATGPVGIGLAAGGALLGLFHKEVIAHRDKIAAGGAAVVTKGVVPAATWAVPKALKATWGVTKWSAKYLTPLGLIFAPLWLKGKLTGK